MHTPLHMLETLLNCFLLSNRVNTTEHVEIILYRRPENRKQLIPITIRSLLSSWNTVNNFNKIKTWFIIHRQTLLTEPSTTVLQNSFRLFYTFLLSHHRHPDTSSLVGFFHSSLAVLMSTVCNLTCYLRSNSLTILSSIIINLYVLDFVLFFTSFVARWFVLSVQLFSCCFPTGRFFVNIR